MGRIVEILIFVVVLVLIYKFLKGLIYFAVIAGLIYFVWRFFQQQKKK